MKTTTSAATTETVNLDTVPANDTRVSGVDKTITVWEIRSKDRKRFGCVYPGEVREGHHAEIVPGKRIRLFGVVSNRVRGNGDVYRRDFAIGDMAEYGSYNLSYYGPIVSITEKTVTIAERCTGEKHRLDLADFDRRNWDFDVAEASASNADTMMRI